jgi:hypothetical protein
VILKQHTETVTPLTMLGTRIVFQLSVRGILQGLRSDRRQREELATDHDCVNLAGVADVFERIHVEQDQFRCTAHLNRSISIRFAQELCRV